MSSNKLETVMTFGIVYLFAISILGFAAVLVDEKGQAKEPWAFVSPYRTQLYDKLFDPIGHRQRFKSWFLDLEGRHERKPWNPIYYILCLGTPVDFPSF